MRPSRPTVLIGLALVFGVATYLVVQHVYGSLPALPGYTPIWLGILAVIEAYLAFTVRSRIRRHPRTRPIEPLLVARFAVLAKATAHGGAIIAGVYAGFVAFTAQDAGKEQIGRDVLVSSVSLGVTLAMVAAALFLENSCRVPPSDRDDEVRR